MQPQEPGMPHDFGLVEPTLACWRAALLHTPAVRSGLPGDAHAVQAWELDDDALAALLAGAAPPSKELDTIDRDPGSGPALVLAYSMERFADLLDYQPPTLQPWLDTAFAAWRGADDRLRLIDPRPLGHLLPQWRGEVGPLLELRDDIARRLLHAPAFSGRCHVCDFGWPDHSCDEPMCWSEFAEVRDGEILWYMDGSALGVRQAWLLPRVRLIERPHPVTKPPA
jgi:hypothetical protein